MRSFSAYRSPPLSADTKGASVARNILLPDRVAAGVKSRWPDRGSKWCDEVERELAHLCERYAARPLAVMRSRYGLVVEVASTDGRNLVFRASPDPAGAEQQHVSVALANIGVGPAVHELLTTDTGTWTVTERIVPGTPIGDMDWSHVDPAAICATLRPMLGQPAPSLTMPSLFDWLSARLQADELTDLAPGTHAASLHERLQAAAILEQLATTPTVGLCHGDASPWNLLMDGTGRIVLVDPRGVSGEVEYDVAVVALKASPFVSPTESLPLLAELVEVDLE